MICPHCHNLIDSPQHELGCEPEACQIEITFKGSLPNFKFKFMEGMPDDQLLMSGLVYDEYCELDLEQTAKNSILIKGIGEENQ